VKRFPVLYYFESGDEAESMTTLLRASVSMCVALRKAGDERRAVPLERALTRLLDDLERDYIGGGAGRVDAGGERDFLERAKGVIAAFAREHRQEPG
jgi:hypothetical protein